MYAIQGNSKVRGKWSQDIRMVKKTCPYCGKDSYSAADDYQWICPYCKRDITDVKAVPADKKNSK